MITEGLYDRGYLVDFNEGDIAFYRTPLYYVGSAEDIYHTVLDGETLHSIAQKHYGSSYSWYVIADVNGQNIPDNLELVVGTVLLIPDLNLLSAIYG